VRSLAVALALLALTACGGDRKQDAGGGGRAGGVDASARLAELGFFDYARTERARRAAIDEVRRDPEGGIYTERTRRFYFADGEDLAEGGGRPFLRRLEPVLRAAGVPKLRIREHFTDSGTYALTVNGRRYTILGADDLDDELFWGVASARTVALVNDVLERAGSRERLYGIAHPASNDFSVFLLTPKLRAAVARITGAADAPFTVTDAPPQFGYSGEGFGIGEPGSVA
jgi:hypothetical protein